MPITCSVKQCKSRRIKNGPITFHKFPKDPVRRSQWVKTLGRKNFVATNYSKVCSKHFEADSFDREKFGGTWLKSTAVPTLFCFTNAIKREDDSSLAQDFSSVETDSVPAVNEKSDASCLRIEMLSDKKTNKDIESRKRRRISYLGDFKDGETYTTEELHLGLKIANKLVKEQGKKLKCLKGINSRLSKKVEKLDAILEEYRKKVYIPSDILKEALARNKKNVIKATANISPSKTNSSSADTSVSQAKKNNSSNETSISPAKANSSLAETSVSSAKTSVSSAKTNNSSGETNISPVKTNSSLAETSASQANTNNSSDERSISPAKVNSSLAETSVSLAKTNVSLDETNVFLSETSSWNENLNN